MNRNRRLMILLAVGGVVLTTAAVFSIAWIDTREVRAMSERALNDCGQDRVLNVSRSSYSCL